jgi:hypothetical protein
MSTQKYMVVNSNNDTCGHNHTTPEAALKCKQKLLNWDNNHKNCSAAWYNSKIVFVGENYNYNSGNQIS